MVARDDPHVSLTKGCAVALSRGTSRKKPYSWPLCERTCRAVVAGETWDPRNAVLRGLCISARERRAAVLKGGRSGRCWWRSGDDTACRCRGAATQGSTFLGVVSWMRCRAVARERQGGEPRLRRHCRLSAPHREALSRALLDGTLQFLFTGNLVP